MAECPICKCTTLERVAADPQDPDDVPYEYCSTCDATFDVEDD
jgi:hypothetical protein